MRGALGVEVMSGGPTLFNVKQGQSSLLNLRVVEGSQQADSTGSAPYTSTTRVTLFCAALPPPLQWPRGAVSVA